MAQADPRRTVPRTDVLMAHPDLVAATARHGAATVKAAVRSAPRRAPAAGEIAPDDVVAAARAALPARSTTLRPVLNATGVVVHTNLGRAPLSAAAVEAVVAAAAYVDVEYDLATGARARRGRGTLEALRAAVPAAGRALVVNNGAAALVLATTALAAGREVVVSRGEMVEIGDGFRLPDLIASTGARLREVGTTNRTPLADYAAALGPDTGCILKVHPSNFRVEGFTCAASRRASSPTLGRAGRRRHRQRAAARPTRCCPTSRTPTTALARRRDRGHRSGDKLLGGPQAGLVLGEAATVERLRRHPLARALRVDKLDARRARGDPARAGRRRSPTTSTPTPTGCAPRTERLAAAVARRGRRRRRARSAAAARPGLRPARLGRRAARGVRRASAARRARRRRARRARPLPGRPALRPAGPRRRRRAGHPGGPRRRRPERRLTVHVVATAGHVDHGKSTLVRALTGMEPDRWAEERRRGMTIDLGYAWTTLPSGADVAFVDVPGHERFIGNMLAGLGPGAGGPVRRRGRRGLAAASRRSTSPPSTPSGSRTGCSS